MRKQLGVVSAFIAAVALAPQARSDVLPFGFSGDGVSGSGELTVGPDAEPGDPAGALAIGNASGTFSDANIGVSGVAITGVVPISPTQGDPLAPHSFSIYAIKNGVPSTPPSPGFSYDDLLYLGGSPVLCSDYPFFGGLLDVYGAAFTLANGDVVDWWSDGDVPGTGISYGVGVTDGIATLDYQFTGVAASVPEPDAGWLFGTALLGLLATGGVGVTRKQQRIRLTAS